LLRCEDNIKIDLAEIGSAVQTGVTAQEVGEL
jgi:hypothetical protein